MNKNLFKNLLKELILPSFWLFFFIVYSKDVDNTIKLKNERDMAFKKQQGMSAAGVKNQTQGQNGETRFTKAVYLAGF